MPRTPMKPSEPGVSPAGDTSVEIEEIQEEQELPEIPMKKVVFLNDDLTPFQFVISVLRTVFQMSQSQAAKLTMQVHENGEGVAGRYLEEVAIEKSKRTHRLARAAGFPLRTQVR